MSLPWPNPNTISMFDMIQILREIVFDKLPTSFRGSSRYEVLNAYIQTRGDAINAADVNFFGFFDDLILGLDWKNRKGNDLSVSWNTGYPIGNYLSCFWLKPNWSISDIRVVREAYDVDKYNFFLDPASPAFVRYSDLEAMLGESLVPSPTRCDKRLWLRWLRQRIRIIDYLQVAISSSDPPGDSFAAGAYRFYKNETDPPQEISPSAYGGIGRTAYAEYNSRTYIWFRQYFYVAGAELNRLALYIENSGFSIHGKIRIAQWGLVQKYGNRFYDFGLDLREDTFVRLGTAEVTSDPASRVMSRELAEPKEWHIPYEGMNPNETAGFTAGETLMLSVYDFSENTTYSGGI